LIKEKLITLKSFKNLKIESSFIKKNVFRHNYFSYKLYIDSKLNIYPCVMERRISYGNLKQLLQKNIETINFTKDNIDGCKECDFRYCCMIVVQIVIK